MKYTKDNWHEAPRSQLGAARAEAYADLLGLPMTELERTAVQALVEHGSQNAAALALGWKRTKVQSHLRRVQARRLAAVAATPEPPVVHGEVSSRRPIPAPVQPGAKVARYILTAAQNNTHVHAPFWANLQAYAEFLGATIMVSRFTYNKSSYGKNSTKVGKAPTKADYDDLWYDPAIRGLTTDQQMRLAPDLLWCAEMNILPTAVLPLSGLESYSGPSSAVFPHAKIALETVPVIGDREPKFNYTTGACTVRNYVAKKEGIKAEFHHAYGAVLVEVDLVTGDWWARHLNATDDGTFYDLTRRVRNGEVTLGHRLEAINWGDVHAIEIDPLVAKVNWAPGGALDILQPKYQFWHDTHSHRNRSHHELKSYEKRLEKWARGPEHDTVEAEVRAAVWLLHKAERDWCQTIVVSSNHDRHIERWLDEADYRQDLPNAEFFLEAQLARTRAIMAGDKTWCAFKWACLRRCGLSPFAARFLERDESFVICGPDHPVECGQHGDEGADGARGNTANYARMAIRMNKGHSHVAMIRNGVRSAAVCNRRLAYAHGPSSWSISHIGTYRNGKGVILTQRAGKLWL